MRNAETQKTTSPVALVIGGSGGIGREIAAKYLHEGYRVIISGLSDDELERVHQKLLQVSSECFSIQCDVANLASVEVMAEQVLAKYGCPDILVNCAGYAVYLTIEQTDQAELEHLVQVNFLGVVRCVKAFLPAMLERRCGIIVNVSSVAGRLIITPCGTYCASKQALVAWSHVLRYELSRFGIQVNVICPGRVETGFFDHETFRKRTPRPENRYVVSSEQVARETVDAVKNNRFITYIPRTFGIAAWFMDIFPWFLRPLYDKLIFSRIETYYAAEE